jgi:uncharacterized protein YggT (Ycf19 family)
MIVTLLIVVYRILQVYFYILIGSILLSWLPELRETQLGRFIDRLASPYMSVFRGLLVFGMFDFTPIIGFIIYQVGMNYLAQMINLIAGS